MIQESQVSKEKLDQKGSRGHMVSRVQSAHLVKKANEAPEVIRAQLVLRAQWEKGVLLAIVAFQALMVYLDQRALKERGVLLALQDLKEVRGIQDVQVNLGFQVLGV